MDRTQAEWLPLLQKGDVIVTYLPIQDPLHVLKKLFGSLDLVRNVYLGAHAVDIGLIRSALESGTQFEDMDFKQVLANSFASCSWGELME